MSKVLKIGLILITIHFTFTATRKLDLTNVVCNSNNNFYLKFEECILKSVNRSYNYIWVAQRMHQVRFPNFVANLQTFKRANGWRPWLYNVSVNVCRFITERHQAVTQFLLGLVELDFDFKDNCNSANRTYYTIHVANTNVLKALKNLPLPNGEYSVKSRWKSKIVEFTIDVSARYQS